MASRTRAKGGRGSAGYNAQAKAAAKYGRVVRVRAGESIRGYKQRTGTSGHGA